jgi:hypothetical protein
LDLVTRTDAPYGESITIYPSSPGYVNNFLLHLPAYGFLNARPGFPKNQFQ